VAFQLSRICTCLLRACLKRLGEGDFEGIVLGNARGKLIAVESIEPGMELAGDDPCILLVKRATGDEEVWQRSILPIEYSDPPSSSIPFFSCFHPVHIPAIFCCMEGDRVHAALPNIKLTRKDSLFPNRVLL
jgi:hypothetical protein